MTTETTRATELVPVGPAVAVTPLTVGGTPGLRLVSVGHLTACVLSLAVGAAAAVGLGRYDWYTWENNFYAFGGAVTTGYQSISWGLRSQTACPFPAYTRFDVAVCTQDTYQAAIHYFNNNANHGAVVAYKHLQGAGAIIIVLLSIILFFAVLGAVYNFVVAFHRTETYYDPWVVRPRHRSAHIVLWIMAILEFLVIIFWITIFPYRWVFDNVRPNINGGSGDYVTYETIGVGFAIQIAGLILAIIAISVTHRNCGYTRDPTALPAKTQTHV